MAPRVLSKHQSEKEEDTLVVREMMRKYPRLGVFVPCGVCGFLCPKSFDEKTRDGKPKHWACEEATPKKVKGAVSPDQGSLLI